MCRAVKLPYIALPFLVLRRSIFVRGEDDEDDDQGKETVLFFISLFNLYFTWMNQLKKDTLVVLFNPYFTR